MSRLIGRDDERARLDGLVVPGAVVTVTGPGGVGKSRLVAELLATRGSGAVTAASLSALPAGAGPAAIADALGFESLDAAALVLATRGGLVVLDGCDHVLAAVREVVETIRAAAPDATVVTTSRSPLGREGEHVLVLGSLAVAPAVALFLERSAAAGAPIEDRPDALEPVAELCRRLDGLPLAIELAAARSRAISPIDLLGAVDERLDLLRRRADAGDRHDSIRAAIDVSIALLDEHERMFHRRLAVFPGPFDLPLATAVASAEDGDRLGTLDALAALVERSLLVAEVSTATAGTRYRQLELLREHALGELVASGDAAAVEARFVDAMVDVADGIVARALAKWDPVLLGAASSHFRNLVRACELCIAGDADPARAYRLVLPLFAAVHEGRPHEVWDLGTKVRARWPDVAAPWRAEALAVLATAAAIAGRHDEVGPLAAEVVDDPASSTIALALADRAWGLATRSADPVAAARHFELAGAAADAAGFASLAREVRAFEAGEVALAGDPPRALAMLATVLRAGDEHDDVFVVVLAHLVRCCVRLGVGDVAAAEQDLVAADAASTAIGQPWWTSAILRVRAAVVAFGPGGWAASTHCWRRAVDDAAGAGALGEVAITLRAAAAVAHHLGATAAADVLFGAAPRSTAITVLPELCTAAAAELAAAAPTHPVGEPVLEALARARRVLGDVADGEVAVPAAPAGDDATEPAPARGELVAEGDSWRVTFGGRTVRVRDMKGIGDLAVLLARPGVEVHALELMGAQDVGGSAGPGLDERARRAYQDRIVELQREIDDTRADHDHGRAERAEVELDALVEQLSEAFGLGGRARATGSSAERARTAVTYRVRSAIRKLSQLHPDLGRHLTNAVRTGTWCAYRPERDVHWLVDGSAAAGRLTV